VKVLARSCHERDGVVGERGGGSGRAVRAPPAAASVGVVAPLVASRAAPRRGAEATCPRLHGTGLIGTRQPHAPGGRALGPAVAFVSRSLLCADGRPAAAAEPAQPLPRLAVSSSSRMDTLTRTTRNERERGRLANRPPNRTRTTGRGSDRGRWRHGVQLRSRGSAGGVLC
jgi:hypothetical protein